MTAPGYNASNTNARQYAEGWMNMMVTIWQEKIPELSCNHSKPIYQNGLMNQIKEVSFINSFSMVFMLNGDTVGKSPSVTMGISDNHQKEYQNPG